MTDDEHSWFDVVIARALLVAASYREADISFDPMLDYLRCWEAGTYRLLLQSHYPDLVKRLEDEWREEAKLLHRQQAV